MSVSSLYAILTKNAANLHGSFGGAIPFVKPNAERLIQFGGRGGVHVVSDAVNLDGDAF